MTLVSRNSSCCAATAAHFSLSRLPVIGRVLTLRPDFEPEVNGSVDGEDDQEGQHELDEAGRHVVRPPGTRKQCLLRLETLLLG